MVRPKPAQADQSQQENTRNDMVPFRKWGFCPFSRCLAQVIGRDLARTLPQEPLFRQRNGLALEANCLRPAPAFRLPRVSASQNLPIPADSGRDPVSGKVGQLLDASCCFTPVSARAWEDVFTPSSKEGGLAAFLAEARGR